MSKQFIHPFGKVAKRYRSFRKTLPAVISNIARNDFERNFNRQGYVNKNGVFIPWKKTSKKRSRTFGDRRRSQGILIGTGKMRRSMRRAPTFNEARVVSNVIYAAAHNEGFKSTVNVKSHTRNIYRKTVEKTRTRSGKYRSRTVNVKTGDNKVKAHTKKMNIAKRPFMITSKTIIDETEKYVFEQLDKIWNS